jgi:hypothetical protein
MKQQPEEVIKKNLPEKNNGTELSDFARGFNQALSQINTSLIADEVLKIVIRKIEEIETFEPEDNFVDGGDSEYASRRLAVDNSRRWGEIKIKTDILQLLSNLSPNKENKNNERN